MVNDVKIWEELYDQIAEYKVLLRSSIEQANASELELLCNELRNASTSA